MGWGDTSWMLNENLKKAPQTVPPTYVSPKAGWYSPDQPVGPSFARGASKGLAGLGAALMAIPGGQPFAIAAEALAGIAGLFSAQKAKQEEKRRRQQAMALQAWQALDEPWRSPRYGGGY
jgi:hypothetical protein